eukprot:GHUV01045649.1.p1 GENE.GHUV01045649.1~~GHUV01045649.1.p1  ORF type:complete len:134 (+),score=15.33 GHUV01045649.1:352-753(+)
MTDLEEGDLMTIMQDNLITSFSVLKIGAPIVAEAGGGSITCVGAAVVHYGITTRRGLPQRALLRPCTAVLLQRMQLRMCGSTVWLLGWWRVVPVVDCQKTPSWAKHLQRYVHIHVVLPHLVAFFVGFLLVSSA